MAVNNPFKITYGSRAVGGDSDDYQLHGPYVLEKTFDTIRVVFDVVVVAETRTEFQNFCDNIETDFRKRDQTLKIDLDAIDDEGGASLWTYTPGSNILNTTSTVTKSGNPQTDRGLSRAYTVVIEGGLPADDASPVTGLREIAWHIAYESGRQKIVSCQGVYTASETPAQTARQNYQHANGADAEATTFLAALDGSATFELVSEEFTEDRNNHEVTFQRQYVELLANQTKTDLDNTSIRDHQMVFTDLSQHPGDSTLLADRLRRVVANYDCAVDIDQTTDLKAVFDDEVMPHIKQFFDTTFAPSDFCVEDRRASYNETTKRLSVAIQFLYRRAGAEPWVEATESAGFRETRTIDYTPVHGKDELGMFADPGWIVLEYVVSRTFVMVGQGVPTRRVSASRVSRSGWNLIANDSRVSPRIVGDGDHEQIELTVVNETLVYRFNNRPSAGTSVPPQEPKVPPPTTGSGGRSGGSAGAKIGAKGAG